MVNGKTNPPYAGMTKVSLFLRRYEKQIKEFIRRFEKQIKEFTISIRFAAGIIPNPDKSRIG